MQQSDLNELLTKAKELLKEETTKISFETWIKDLEIESFSNGNVVLSISTTFKRDSIESRYHDLLVNTFNFLTNKECSVSILSKEEENKKQSEGEDSSINLDSNIRLF